MNLSRIDSGKTSHGLFRKRWNLFKSYGCNLQYASEELQSNCNIVMAAIREGGGALQYASEELQGSYNIVMAAIRKSGGSLQYASEELKSNFDVVMAALRSGGTAALRGAHATLVENVELVSQSIRSNNNSSFATVLYFLMVF